MIYIANKDFHIDKRTALTVGNFDGLHAGHRKLISLTMEYAAKYSLASAVLSFAPHPVSVLSDPNYKTILSSREKRFLLENIGADYFVEYPFDKPFARITPERFVREIILDRLNCRVLALGEGFRFGKDKAGSYSTLLELCRERNVLLVSCKYVRDNDEKISSSDIKRLIAERRFDEIQRLLSIPYFVSGVVQHGRKIGRTIGVPTVNLIPEKNKALPPKGIYFTKTNIDGLQYYSVTNIGNNPTVKYNPEIIIETYIWGFDGDLYDKTIFIDFFGYSRPEMKFNSVDELKAVINNDISAMKQYFGI